MLNWKGVSLSIISYSRQHCGPPSDHVHVKLGLIFIKGQDNAIPCYAKFIF